MCGIAGIVGANSIEDIQQRLQRMQAALRHRGPDDQGLFISADGGVGLAHTRLSIIDLGPSGHQPMTTSDGQITIVFNGEIYNFRELRTGLQSAGVRFRSNSDTEVILSLYERHGADCVKHLRGMFAFAIWDAREGLCLLARDPLGIKPLYFTANTRHSNTLLAFASEVRTLVVGGLVPDDISPAGLRGYLRSGSVPEPLTMIEGVECLPAGSTLIFRDGKFRHSTYWKMPDVEDDSGKISRREIVERARQELLNSVRAHFVSDVPVGIFLSGGIDSTAIVALARAIGQTEIATFSIAFDDPAYDEGVVSARTAEAFGTRHQRWMIDGSSALDLLDLFFKNMDQPTVDGFNTWCVARFASRAGSKVVLSGLGADELFGGYPSFRSAPLLQHAGRIPRALRTHVGALIQGVAQKPQTRRLGEFLQGEGQLEDAWQSIHAIFTWSEVEVLAEWLLSGRGGSRRERHLVRDADATGESALETIGRLETTLYMRNQLLRDADVMSMAWGLELRVPFVDSELTGALCRFPTRERFRPGKRLLIDAVPEIPDWIVNRPKTGFTFPFDRWMRNEWSERVAAGTANAPVRLETWYRRWILMAFQQWRQNLRTVEQPAVPDVR